MPAADLFLTMSEELVMRLLASYYVEAVGTLNNDPESWEVFMKVVRTFLRPGMYVPGSNQVSMLNLFSRDPARSSENCCAVFNEWIVWGLEPR
jgi:hypothetical protein